MKFENEYIVGIKDIAINNSMTNYSILGFMEEIACLHSNEAGYGINDLPNTQKVWLIMDWKLEVFVRPKYGDKLTVKTWARPIEKRMYYTYRDFEIFRGNTKVAVATSKWIMLDLKTNKITRLNDEIMELYNPENEQVFENKELDKLVAPQGLESSNVISYQVKRADIDINKHMHNLNYLKIAYEALPDDIFFGEEMSNVRIMYKTQILLGQKLKCYYYKQKEKNIIVIRNNDDSVLHAIIELY